MKGYLKGLALVYIIIGAATAVHDLSQLAVGKHTAFMPIGAGSLSLLAAVAVYLLAEIAENTTQRSWAGTEAERLAAPPVARRKSLAVIQPGTPESKNMTPAKAPFKKPPPWSSSGRRIYRDPGVRGDRERLPWQTGDQAPCHLPNGLSPDDVVTMPTKKQFDTEPQYYLFHEIIHSTGTSRRLSRCEPSVFGCGKSAKEELVAEYGSAMQCGLTDINKPAPAGKFQSLHLKPRSITCLV